MREETFGAQVQRRRGLGLTQAQLAHTVGCVEDMIRKMESGRRRPSAQIAVRLADQLAVPVQECAQFVLDARLAQGACQRGARYAVPLPIDAFVGREDDLQAIGARLLHPDVRLLTLVERCAAKQSQALQARQMKRAFHH